MQKSPLENNMIDIIKCEMNIAQKIGRGYQKRGNLTVCWLLGAAGMNLWRSDLGRFGGI